MLNFVGLVYVMCILVYCVLVCMICIWVKWVCNILSMLWVKVGVVMLVI